MSAFPDPPRCSMCDGKGYVPIPYREYDPRRWAMCRACNGTGRASKQDQSGEENR